MLMRHGIQGNAKFAIIFGKDPTLALTWVVGRRLSHLPYLNSTSLFRKLTERFVHQFESESNGPQEE